MYGFCGHARRGHATCATVDDMPMIYHGRRTVRATQSNSHQLCRCPVTDHGTRAWIDAQELQHPNLSPARHSTEVATDASATPPTPSTSHAARRTPRHERDNLYLHI
eukprot:scaffold34889_cov49-Phaeocystis_antarctica.AAC.2